MAVSLRDRDIITKSFRLLTQGTQPSDLLDKMDWDRYFNVFSSATGDNRYINPIPQSSPATDPRYGRFMQTREGGMGSMWKDMYEDNVTLLTLVPCVPQFGGLLPFITNMFSPTAAIMANKGRAPGLAFAMGQAVGAIAFWPMQLLSVSVQFFDFLTEQPTNNFYSLKSAMGPYIMASTGILNDIMVKLGYIDPVLPKRAQEQPDSLYGLPPGTDNSKAIAALNQLIPDCVNKDGTIDLMRLVMRGTRKHRVLLAKLAQLDNAALATPADKLDAIKKVVENVQFSSDTLAGTSSQSYIEKEMGTVGKVRGATEGNFIEQDSAYLKQGAYTNINDVVSGAKIATFANADGTLGTSGTPGPTTMTDAKASITPTPPTNPNQKTGLLTSSSANAAVANGTQISYDDNPNDRTWAGDVLDLVQTAVNGGLDAITFRVDGSVGSTTDSFSNSHSPSPMAEKFNSIVKQGNDFRFDIQAGATGIGIIDSVVNTLKEGAIGALSGTVIGNIPLALVNNSYVKIADHWDGSTVNLHRESYSLSSHCTYAHPYEQIMKIWVLFSLLLPFIAPNTAGGSTYTAPFMCKAFCQSRSMIRIGMMENMTFTFGEGDAGWTRDRKPLNFKASWDVVDLDGLVSVPIDRSMSLLRLTNPSDVAQRVFSDDSAYNSYLSRLTGVSYLDTVMKWARLNRSLTSLKLDLKTSISAENIAQKVNSSLEGDLLRVFSRPISR
jgi:hypothetical protein